MFATATSIAIWFPPLEHMGGIERVILEHIWIFSERGHKLVLVQEEVPTRFKSLITCPCVVMLKTQERKLQWAQIKQAHSPQASAPSCAIPGRTSPPSARIISPAPGIMPSPDLPQKYLYFNN